MAETAYQRWGKRALDLSLALLLAAPALILVIPIAGLIRVGSPGPALLRQTRVGRHGELFTCYKLRTMFVDTPQRASHETSAAAITPIGRLLRSTKLDELPQLLNVLRNEMSFVGPRPCLPVQAELVEARRRLGVLAALPGVTGVSQVAGVDMSNPEGLAVLDATYVGHERLPWDLVLIWRTIAGGGRGDRVRAAG